MRTAAREKHAALMRLRNLERRMEEIMRDRNRKRYLRKFQELCDQAQADFELIAKEKTAPKENKCPAPISADMDQLSLKF